MKTTLLLATLLLGGTAHAQDAEPTIEELLDATDDVARGESSRSVIQMQVKQARYERTMKMEAKSEGTDNSLIVILEPAKESGTATLKVGDNLWNYLPKTDKTMKIPAGMMSGSWMGSHFSNDDLVKGSRMKEDYTYTLTGKPTEAAPDDPYVIELVPKPDAPVVWGKVVTRVSKDKVPVDVKYYDEKDTLIRTMSFTDVQEVGDKLVPMTMTIQPADEPEQFTRITYDTLEFDVDFPKDTFSLKALKE